MSKAEEFIESYTRKCSNEIDQLGADIAAFQSITHGSLPTMQEGLLRLQGKRN